VQVSDDDDFRSFLSCFNREWQHSGSSKGCFFRNSIQGAARVVHSWRFREVERFAVIPCKSFGTFRDQQQKCLGSQAANPTVAFSPIAASLQVRDKRHWYHQSTYMSECQNVKTRVWKMAHRPTRLSVFPEGRSFFPILFRLSISDV
jgi:hypothetical protein